MSLEHTATLAYIKFGGGGGGGFAYDALAIKTNKL